MYLEHFIRITFYVGVASYASNAIIVATQQELPPHSLFFFSLGLVWNAAILFFMLIMIRGDITIMMLRSKLPKGNLGLPFLGNTIAEIRNPLTRVQEDCEKYGGMYLTHIFFDPAIRMASDEDVTWLWNSEKEGLTKAVLPPHIAKLFGESALIFASGRRHRILRRMLEPAFMPLTIKDYAGTIDQVVRSELERLSGSSSFQPTTVFKPVALSILIECVFGSGMLDQHETDGLCQDFKIWLGAFTTLFPFDLPGTSLRTGMNARRRVVERIEKLIKKHRAEKSKSLMGRLLNGTDDKSEPLSTKDLADNILVILMAGHDTVYASIGSVLYFLDQHADAKKALLEEIGGLSEPLDVQELKDAPILNAVMAETWRIAPGIVFAFKEAVRDVAYKGYQIPKGMKFTYSISYGGHNPQHYRDSDEFRIERFLPPNHPFVKDSAWCTGIDYEAAASKVKFRTFGGGVHSCFGLHFAKLELRIFLVRLLQQYDVELKNSTLLTMPIYCWVSQFRLKDRE